MARLRIISLTATVAMALGCLGGTATASDICMRLEARLAALDSSPASRGEERRIRRQRAELEQATEQARRAGCLGGSFFRELVGGRHCGRLMASVERARANLDRLRARTGAADDIFPGDDERERAQLVRALAANRCGAQYEAHDRPSRRHGLFATLFGGLGTRFRERGWGPDNYFHGGTYRTLCVRTCDGYYFPISFATVESRFAADEQACHAMCPGTDVALYVHHNPGEESDAMVSLAGEPYTALPAAFRYRKEYDASCACGRMAAPRPGSETSLAVSLPARDDPWGFARSAEAPPPVIGDAPVAEVRPAPGEDPETSENRAGSYVPAPVVPRQDAVAKIGADGEKQVRIVGPAYYYGQ